MTEELRDKAITAATKAIWGDGTFDPTMEECRAYAEIAVDAVLPLLAAVQGADQEVNGGDVDALIARVRRDIAEVYTPEGKVIWCVPHNYAWQQGHERCALAEAYGSRSPVPEQQMNGGSMNAPTSRTHYRAVCADGRYSRALGTDLSLAVKGLEINPMYCARNQWVPKDECGGAPHRLQSMTETIASTDWTETC